MYHDARRSTFGTAATARFSSLISILRLMLLLQLTVDAGTLTGAPFFGDDDIAAFGDAIDKAQQKESSCVRYCNHFSKNVNIIPTPLEAADLACPELVDFGDGLPFLPLICQPSE
jgi:hypothetical protein